tara:strand:- start:938 stop:1564 length:627 start_codon:yes stop_codon:yes gene_type:complete
MSSNWAEENLQVIRTLMERSVLYRRTMAPMTLIAGILGFLGAGIGHFQKLNDLPSFLRLWCIIAGIGLLVAARLIRTQAMKSEEPFWTPPAKRIFQAMLPAFIIGGGFTAPFVFPRAGLNPPVMFFVVSWLVLYGFGLHSAGFFVAKGIKRLGWIFLFSGMLVTWNELTQFSVGSIPSPHILMGTTFGGFHFVSWIYLLFTEKKDETA